MRRLSIYFVRTDGGLKKIPPGLAKPGDPVPLGPTTFVALRAGRGGAIEVFDLKAKSAAAAFDEVEPSQRLGIPIARSRSLGVVFQVAIAPGGETSQNQS